MNVICSRELIEALRSDNDGIQNMVEAFSTPKYCLEAVW
ncbi:MAG: hypothetical protein ACI8UX_002120 [Psychromonas sp.]|jgi:hypothetical protein